MTLRQIVFRYEAIIQNRSTATRHECERSLLWSHETLSVQFQDDIDDVQSTIWLALLVHALIRIWDLKGVQASGTLAHNLRKSLVITSTMLDTDAPDLRIWIFFLGAQALQGRKGHGWWEY